MQSGEWSRLTRYCEGDVLNTWLIYLRWLLLKGQLLLEEHTSMGTAHHSIFAYPAAACRLFKRVAAQFAAN